MTEQLGETGPVLVIDQTEGVIRSPCSQRHDAGPWHTDTLYQE